MTLSAPHGWFREAHADGTTSRTATCLRCFCHWKGRDHEPAFPCEPDGAALGPVRDGGEWQGPTVEEYVTRIAYGSQRILDDRRHSGAVPVVRGPGERRRAERRAS